VSEVSFRPYLLCFSATGAPQIAASVYTYVRDATHIATWWNYIPGVFVFVSTRTLAELQMDFLPFFGGEFFLMLPVDPVGAGGYLPKAAWDWLNTAGYTRPEPPVNALTLLAAKKP
jgi:hypothetical protein